jgi:hypothetical protein
MSETRSWKAWAVQLPNGDLASGGTRPALFTRKREAQAWMDEDGIDGKTVKGVVDFTFIEQDQDAEDD